MSTISEIDPRYLMREATLPDESDVLKRLVSDADLSTDERKRISVSAAQLVREIRENSDPGLMESFLAEYGLSTDEGIALMCLAEALLRVPDAETIDALIEDKIAPSDWGKHLGQSSSSLVNASTWALMLTGKVLDDDESGLLGTLRGAVKRLGEPVIRTAVGQAMREMGRQFVLGQTINEAMQEADAFEKEGYTYSYDMLGEAARTEADARRYHLSYSEAINQIAKACVKDDVRENPGISVKLSALHPRYEYGQRQRVLDELVPRARSLALLAKSAGMGFNIDAEEADRLDLSLDVIEAVVSDPSLAGWDGFGVVVQAYSPRASHVIDWLYNLAGRFNRRFMVRLVKGAYWDTEVKRAQTLGLDGFPVFTRKASTDVSYIANAKRLLGMIDRIYPQFATHNAHSVCAILELAGNRKDAFEFQRLHGMGEALHGLVMKTNQTRCRIYAPVGRHRDLLAYLVRRLLENGANSSFVNQIVDEEIAPEEIAKDPFLAVEDFMGEAANRGIARGPDLFRPSRVNSIGYDMTDPIDMTMIDDGRGRFQTHQWHARPLTAAKAKPENPIAVFNPAIPSEEVGTVCFATAEDVQAAIGVAKTWENVSVTERSLILNRAADLYEKHAFEFFALLTREAGKAMADCINEVREAVDFLRFYAHQANLHPDASARGIFTCISPWNFPLAIFTGQISAALSAGNGVLAKPAEATSLVAYRAVELLHEAGVPAPVLQLLPGLGNTIGTALTSSDRIDGVCFTGSTQTAQVIHRGMAKHASPDAPLIAETGGLNAMIVDSTALPEQVVRDVIASAYQSAGQRCSALRVLYLQDEIADLLLEMLMGAMDELSLGNPWLTSSDIGPVIDVSAKEKIEAHIEIARKEDRLLKQLDAPGEGYFVGPALLSLSSITELNEEIFGPVLHVVRFQSDDLEQVISDINSTGYGLTFGLHTRIDDRVQHIIDSVHAGNIYVNRNQIGAVVGSQPFGGEGLSGTGPKAGGPNYIRRFMRSGTQKHFSPDTKPMSSETANTLPEVQSLIDSAKSRVRTEPLREESLPGPTGESNQLMEFARGVVLCLGPRQADLDEQLEMAQEQGCSPVSAVGLDPELLVKLRGYDAVTHFGSHDELRPIREALAKREGAILPLIASIDDMVMLIAERHVCIDTTASGGNTALLAAQA